MTAVGAVDNKEKHALIMWEEAVVVVDTDDDEDEDTMSKNDFDGDVEWIEETTTKMAVLPIEEMTTKTAVPIECCELPFWAVLDDSRLFALG